MLGPIVDLTARPLSRLFRLVFESHGGRALVPIPKRSTSPRATTTLVDSLKSLTLSGRLEKHFTGEEFFQHEFPHERSDLSHWRKRLGDKLELLLAESLRVAHASGALRTRDLKRVTVDTTVQPKAITFPTDAKLLHAAIKGLNRLASKHGVRLRQSYLRIAKCAAMMAGRYAHAKQFNRHRRELRILRTRLGRIIRDIQRRIVGKAELEAAFAWPLSCASQIRSQQQRQRG